MSRISLLQDALRSLDYGIAIEPSSVWHEEVRAEVEKEPAKLTDEEIEEIHREFPSRIDLFARAIEQKIWEKNS